MVDVGFSLLRLKLVWSVLVSDHLGLIPLRVINARWALMDQNVELTFFQIALSRLYFVFQFLNLQSI